MREGEPSRTAYGAARMRALHQEVDGGRIFRDPLAVRILGDLEPFDADPGWPAWVAAQGRLRAFIAVRHRFAEDALAAAVEGGTRQVVVLGAGLDTFAYRNPWPETRVFEVDFPATGAWKRERVAAAGIEVPGNLTYVGVDFELDDLLARLADAGFAAEAPAFFVWLGVVPYLTRPAVLATLRAIVSVPGAEVVLDYRNPTDPARDRPERAELRDRVAAVGEPFADGLDTADLHAALRDLGFDEIEDIGRREIRSRYLGLPPGDADGDSHVLRAVRRP